MASPLDLYPRARLAAYSDPEDEWLCADCAAERHGAKAVWQALHLIKNDPGLRQIPLGSLLRESPLEPCCECHTLLWDVLPDRCQIPAIGND